MEYYGRIQKEDYDNIALECQDVKERTSQTSENLNDESFAYFFPESSSGTKNVTAHGGKGGKQGEQGGKHHLGRIATTP